MTGTDNEYDLNQLKIQIEDVMKSAYLNLRKWSSNSEKLISKIPIEGHEVSPIQINDQQSYVKVLGIF